LIFEKSNAMPIPFGDFHLRLSAHLRRTENPDGSASLAARISDGMADFLGPKAEEGFSRAAWLIP
jgi:hypothetical protein